MFTNFFKSLTVALTLGLATCASAPVTAQETVCQTPSNVYSDFMNTPGINGIVKVVTDTRDLGIVKKIISEEYSIPPDQIISFDRIEYWDIAVSIGPEYDHMYWVVVYDKGCVVQAFAEEKRIYERVKRALAEVNDIKSILQRNLRSA